MMITRGFQHGCGDNHDDRDPGMGVEKDVVLEGRVWYKTSVVMNIYRGFRKGRV
jgi:hypothetical protein